MMKLMRSSEVSNLFCNLKKSSRKVVWYCTKVVAFSDRRLWNEWGLLKFLKFKYEHFRSLFKAAEYRFQNLNVSGKSLEFISQSQIRGDYNLNKVRRLVTSIYAKKNHWPLCCHLILSYITIINGLVRIFEWRHFFCVGTGFSQIRLKELKWKKINLIFGF